jgi:hypothetical protein
MGSEKKTMWNIRSVVSLVRGIFKNKEFTSASSTNVGGQQNFDDYVNCQPTNQALVDLIDGWNCAFPKRINVEAGELHLYADPRINWAVAQANGIDQKKILEIGPLEGGHSFLLQSYRPLLHIAVEASQRAFLKCLIAKELYPLSRVQFKLGDGVAYLNSVEEEFDLIVASGVLYHLQDPLRFLSLAAAKSRQLYLWTHFIDNKFGTDEADTRLSPFLSAIELDNRFGFPVRFRRRRYQGAQKNKEFCGGIADEHIWLHKEDLINVLRHLGFKSIIIAHEQPEHKNGPACSIFAGRE